LRGSLDSLLLSSLPLLSEENEAWVCVGVLLSEDQDGEDSKIIAVPITEIDSNFSGITDLKNIPDYMLSKLEHFIKHHKDLEEGKYVKVKALEGKEAAKKKISGAIEKYNKK
jgi:inorganic pyrophosphatase